LHTCAACFALYLSDNISTYFRLRFLRLSRFCEKTPRATITQPHWEKKLELPAEFPPGDGIFSRWGYKKCFPSSCCRALPLLGKPACNSNLFLLAARAACGENKSHR
jgi:hypothetical protein